MITVRIFQLLVILAAIYRIYSHREYKLFFMLAAVLYMFSLSWWFNGVSGIIEPIAIRHWEAVRFPMMVFVDAGEIGSSPDPALIESYVQKAVSRASYAFFYLLLFLGVLGKSAFAGGGSVTRRSK